MIAHDCCYKIEPHLSEDDLFRSLGCTEELTKAFIWYALADIILFDNKQHDRGPENIARHGAKGVVLRLWDKLARIDRVIWKGTEPKVSEPIEQDLADLSVYGVIARMCRDGLWPGVPKFLDKPCKGPPAGGGTAAASSGVGGVIVSYQQG